MVSISKTQLGEFSAQARQSFEDRLVRHLQDAFPTRYAELGEFGARAAIRAGCSRAPGYGLRSERNVARFVDLMVTVGADFDSSPATPWAREILTDDDLTPDEKLEELFDEAQDELRSR